MIYAWGMKCIALKAGRLNSGNIGLRLPFEESLMNTEETDTIRRKAGIWMKWQSLLFFITNLNALVFSLKLKFACD
jgi:hypothetical protein